MIERIKALVAAGLTMQFSYLRKELPTIVVYFCDPDLRCLAVSTEYDWQHGGDVDATIEAAVSKAEAYLAREDHGVKVPPC